MQEKLEKVSTDFSRNCVIPVKFGFSQKATKFEKIFVILLKRAFVLCARNSVLVKKSTKIFQNKCRQVVLYKLY